ncbi:MAG: hypothetical protein A3K77_06290 [Euryarchaeota archaeon RBG_13_31_8]|nr:MAG: hypothetical protein A3K77_06290 [Euryarchaeota archaeon RBG_13_31_8]
MSNIISLFDVEPREEIFIQYYLLNGNIAESAFHSHFLDLKNEYGEIDKLPNTRYKDLHKAGTNCLKKEKVKARISQLAAEQAQKESCASLTEIMAYLTTIIRKSKENEYKNIMLVNSAIKAVETLIKRYPNFEGSAEQKESISFSRGEAK